MRIRARNNTKEKNTRNKKAQKDYLAFIASGIDSSSSRGRPLRDTRRKALQQSEIGSELASDSMLRFATSDGANIPANRRYGVGLSCRIEADLYATLQQDAYLNGISLNSLVGSILRKHATWYKYANVVGFISIPKETIKLLLDCLTEEESSRISDSMGRALPREMIPLIYQAMDFKNVVNFIEVILSQYGIVQRHLRDDVRHILLHHGVSKEFSKFLAGFLSAMADDMSLKLKLLTADSRVLAIEVKE